MDPTVIKIAMAGLIHDIGKFAQGCLDITPDYRAGNAGLYQPFYNHHHTHQHVLFTAAFIEQLADKLPHELNSSSWGEGDSFINLAAGHHLPSTPMQWIIAAADRISSGQDRATFDKGQEIRIKDYLKTRLLSLFEQLDINGAGSPETIADFKWRYPLSPLSAQSVFPVPTEEADSEDGKKAYQRLFDQFVERLTGLLHRDDSIELWFQHFDSLLQSMTSMIPAARVGNVVPDVSLYDHVKTTGALAAALYIYHRDTETLNEAAVKENDTQKLLLIGSDFFGIQEFIFSSGGESVSYRSKLLRGRSFGVSLFSELAADILCRKIGLPHLSVVLNAAGKFTIIAPNTKKTRDQIEEAKVEINEWLYRISYGQSSMGFTVTAAAPADFESSQFSSLWERHKREMETSKACRLDLARFGGTVADYLDTFNNDLGSQLCPLCGKRPSHADSENDAVYLGGNGSACRICRDHIMLGTNLVKGSRVAILEAGADLPRKNRLLEPLFDSYQVAFLDDADEALNSSDHLLKLWNIGVAKDGSVNSDASTRLINGYVPIYAEADRHDDRLLSDNRTKEDLATVEQGIIDGRPKTFGDIARLALNIEQPHGVSRKGTEALGILKADIDDLGLLMGCGLKDERYTISRMATLSRQLDSFFSLYLPYLLENDERFSGVYTVFAGGDDLFLIGPWSRMTELAVFLRERFNEYVCKNGQVHFSAGITMHKPHVPVDKLASQTEKALEQSKDAGKNRVTVFGETVTWETFEELSECQVSMEHWLGSYLSRAMFYRLNELVGMARKEQHLDGQEVYFEDMHCLQWRSRLHYSLVRNLDRSLKGTEREKALHEVQNISRWMHEHGGALKIPLWQVLYSSR